MRSRLRFERIPSAVLDQVPVGLAICCASVCSFLEGPRLETKQPGLLFLVGILRHRPEIVLGVLEIILRRDPVSRQSFGAGQDQVAFIVPLCVLRVPRLGAGMSGRFGSP